MYTMNLSLIYKSISLFSKNSRAYPASSSASMSQKIIVETCCETKTTYKFCNVHSIISNSILLTAYNICIFCRFCRQFALCSLAYIYRLHKILVRTPHNKSFCNFILILATWNNRIMLVASRSFAWRNGKE